MSVSAGQLNKKITLKVPNSARVNGEKVTAYASILNVRASIEMVNQQRAIEAAPVLVGSDRVTVRYSTLTKDITKHWLVNYDNKDHTVHSIEVLGHNEFIKLLVKANG